ncbi:MAG: alkaline phosphatase family protein [Chitinophagaceae bacterium]|nr:alkaline phosphatase family protein [Chitinophagaceae bacterium]
MGKQLSFVGLTFYVLACSAQPDTVQKIITGRTNSAEQQQKPYVILISADGFRYDYAEKYGAKNLLALANSGVKAEAMIPSYPTVTFPNHYSIATGLYPSHHGLVNNYFYSPGRKQFYSMKDRQAVRDGTWYGGIPVWVLAEQQHMLSASFYWVGSEAAIKGIRPTYYYQYNEDIPIERRIQGVVDWLELPADRRPHLITFYIPEVDDAGHDYGPDAPETARAVKWVDSVVQKLYETVQATGLRVNFLFVSDHGMTNIETIHTLPMPAAVDTGKFYIPRGFELAALYAKNKKDIRPVYRKLKKQEKGFTAYLKTNMPSYLCYSKKDDHMNVIGDILLVPDWPRTFNFYSGHPDPGAHGFDPLRVKDMQAVFYAWGPDLKNIQIPAFENIHVYPVMARLLGLSYTHTIDGNAELADRIVK